jgi:Putative prokaryotic signal transducing protein
MSETELVVVRTFSDHFAADVAKTALDAAGIECFVRSDDAGGEYPGLSIGRGAQLVVRAEDGVRADEILNSSDPRI